MQMMPISDIVKLDLHWVRGEDARFAAIMKSLKRGEAINEAIKLIQCACGKTYILQDGGHRITAAHKLFQQTGKDTLIPVDIFQSDIP
ncbi:hypothetical protein [Enterovibrio baiacu]|uniref:hypothetical protein n=1 Tax=Enterovibrio baiacu TaxID=2491023 RepID=UPI003D0968BC